MRFSENCTSIIEEFEGFRNKPYYDEEKVPTIGYGSTYYEDGSRVKITDKPIDKTTALKLLLIHLNKEVLPELQKDIKVPLNQNQIDALGSFIYNVGSTNFRTSSLLKDINNKSNIDKTKVDWLVWHYDNHKSIDGLLRRRELEFNLFIKPV